MMITITGPFPRWVYRIAPTVALASGVVIGANTPDPAGWTQGALALWLAVIVGVISLGVCNGMEPEDPTP